MNDTERTRVVEYHTYNAQNERTGEFMRPIVGKSVSESANIVKNDNSPIQVDIVAVHSRKIRRNMPV